MLRYDLLCDAMLCDAIMYCTTVLYYTILYYTILYYTVPPHTILQYLAEAIAAAGLREPSADRISLRQRRTKG